MFHCVVMGANTKRGSRTQNEIVASKRELPVKNIKHPYSYVTPCYSITLSHIITVHLYVLIRKGIPRLRKILDYSPRYVIL